MGVGGAHNEPRGIGRPAPGILRAWKTPSPPTSKTPSKSRISCSSCGFNGGRKPKALGTPRAPAGSSKNWPRVSLPGAGALSGGQTGSGREHAGGGAAPRPEMRKANVEWALVGGFAVSAYAGGRATADIDLALAVSSNREVDRVVFELTALGYEPGVILEDAETGLTSTVRMFSPGKERRAIYVDLLVNTCGIEAEVVAAAQARRIRPDLELNVALIGHLLALKVLSEREDRLQDRIDIQNLLAVATEEELDTARQGMALIMERGRAREKDLLARFREFQRP